MTKYIQRMICKDVFSKKSMGENQEFIAHISVIVFKYSLTIEFIYKTLSEILTEMIWLKTNMETRVYAEN